MFSTASYDKPHNDKAW